MNPRYKPLLLGVAIAAAGIALVAGLRLGSRGAAPAAAATPTDQAPLAAQAVVEPARLPAETPPWMQAPPRTAPAAAQVTLPNQKSLSPVEAAQVVSQVRSQANRNIATVDGLLAQLDQLSAQPDKSKDINLDAVRTNLLVARRAQTIALEMAEATQRPESAQKDELLRQLVTELQGLQEKLRYDVNSKQPVRTQ